jgi:hypothetical protein
MNYALIGIWLASIAWLTRKKHADSEQMAMIKRLARNFTTATLLASIVMGGFVLLCEKTEPKATPEAQADTVFDRSARYD